VTGGCGFIGSNLVRWLLREKGFAVVNLDRLTYAGRRESLSDLEGEPGYAFEPADLCDAGALSRILESHRPDAVMHLAAETHVDRSIDGPEAFVQSNVVGTFRLLEACLAYWRKLPDGTGSPGRESFRFVHVSTDEVYGSLAKDAAPFTERSPYDPRSPYSASKAASDHLVRAWHTTYGLPVVLTNCSNNYGPFQFPEKLVPLVILKCLRDEPIPVYGKGDNVRDWLYVTDHCEALSGVLARGRVGETYLIGGRQERSNLDLVETLCAIMDERAPRETDSNRTGRKSHRDRITFVADRPGHDFRYAIDSSKVEREIGWKPVESLESGLAKTVGWYLRNRQWWQPILDRSYHLQRLGAPTRDSR